MSEAIEALAPAIWRSLPFVLVLLLAALLLVAARRLLERRDRRRGALFPFGSQAIMLLITAIAILAGVFALPVSEATRGQLLSLIGIVLTGIIAFSSTTFVSNAMAGLMLRAVGNFRPGDWVRVGEQFGRVTERGVFHTELQTEDRDLATLPNLYLVANPMVVVRESGTIVSVRLSLGYERHHAELEPILAGAAQAAGLDESFVQIVELGDFSVTYRVAGFLAEVKHLLTARSRLRAEILDALHGAGIEIVSPSFMNQRQIAPETRVVPAREIHVRSSQTDTPDELIFDKAEEKASIEELAAERRRLEEEIAMLEESQRAGTSEQRATATAEIDRRRARADMISRRLDRERSRREG